MTDYTKMIERIQSELHSELGQMNISEEGSIPSPIEFVDAIDVANIIDHTALKATVDETAIHKLCAEAKQFGFASVCVNGRWVSEAVQQLKGSTVMTITVVGFPLGAHTTESKAFQAAQAVLNGAQEIDMVVSVGDLKKRNHAYVLQDIRRVVESVSVPVKVILETCLLEPEEVVIGSILSKMAGAAFVKTSTGFGGGGARVEDVALMRQSVGPHMGVKASGGVRSFEDVCAMVQAGATRIGASSGVAIVQGMSGTEGY